MIGFGTAVQPALVALRTSGALWHPTLACGAGDGLDQQLGLAVREDGVFAGGYLLGERAPVGNLLLGETGGQREHLGGVAEASVLEVEGSEVRVGAGIRLECQYGLEGGDRLLKIAGSAAEQTNFDAYPLLQLYQAPAVEVRIHERGKSIRGIGEVATPAAAPALGNAIFAATGQRIRELPFSKHIRFV